MISLEMYCADTYQARFINHPFYPDQSQYAYLLNHYTSGPDMSKITLFDNSGRPFVLGAVIDATISQRRLINTLALDQSVQQQKHQEHTSEWQAYTNFHDIQYDQCFGDLVRYRAALRERANMMEDWDYPPTPGFREMDWQGPKRGPVCTPPIRPGASNCAAPCVSARLSPQRSKGALAKADHDMPDVLPVAKDEKTCTHPESPELNGTADFAIALAGRFAKPLEAVHQDHRTQRLSRPQSTASQQAKTERAKNTSDSEDRQDVGETTFWSPQDLKPFELEVQQGAQEDATLERARGEGWIFWRVHVLKAWLGK